MLLADLSLARRVEAGEAVVGFESARSLAHIYPESGAVALMVAGGCAAYVGAGSPFNQATGVGMNGPVTEADFDGLESFYRSRASAVRIMRSKSSRRGPSTRSSPSPDEVNMIGAPSKGWELTLNE